MSVLDLKFRNILTNIATHSLAHIPFEIRVVQESQHTIFTLL